MTSVARLWRATHLPSSSPGIVISEPRDCQPGRATCRQLLLTVQADPINQPSPGARHVIEEAILEIDLPVQR